MAHLQLVKMGNLMLYIFDYNFKKNVSWIFEIVAKIKNTLTFPDAEEKVTSEYLLCTRQALTNHTQKQKPNKTQQTNNNNKYPDYILLTLLYSEESKVHNVPARTNGRIQRQICLTLEACILFTPPCCFLLPTVVFEEALCSDYRAFILKSWACLLK